MSLRKYSVIMHRNHVPVGGPRYYGKLATALPKCIERLVLDGQPGDTYEVAHRDFGFQVATVRVGVHGRSVSTYLEEMRNETVLHGSPGGFSSRLGHAAGRTAMGKGRTGRRGHGVRAGSKGLRHRIPDRAHCARGVLEAGIPWAHLP